MRIDIYLSAPISMTTPVMFDSLLALCWHIDNGRYEAPVKDEEYVQEELPLVKESGVWKASAGFITGVRKKDTWHKRFLFDFDYMIDFGNKQKAVRTGSGTHKSYSMPIVYIPAKKIVFFAEGDSKEVARLLKHLVGIGKKHAIGYGMIKSVEITEGCNDKTTLYNNRVMRSVPCKGENYENRKQMLACRMPYHDKRNLELCWEPEWLFKTVEAFEEYTGEPYEV